MPCKDVPAILGEKALELGIDAPKYNYVPDSPLVLYHTTAVEPESSEKIYFEVLHKKGKYWIICTSPRHSYFMKVKVNVI